MPNVELASTIIPAAAAAAETLSVPLPRSADTLRDLGGEMAAAAACAAAALAVVVGEAVGGVAVCGVPALSELLRCCEGDDGPPPSEEDPFLDKIAERGFER